MKKLILLVFTTLLLTSCNQSEPQTLETFAMDTYMNLTITGKNSELAIEEIREKIMELDALLSRVNEDSDVYKINSAGGNPVEVSEETYEIIEIAKALSAKTDNAFTPAISALTDLWLIGTENARVPSADEISSVLDTLSHENIVLDNGSVTLLNNAKIDLGAIGKGYLADEIVEIIENHDIDSAVISLGGNIYVTGDSPREALWNVGVANPDDASETIGYFSITDMSIVTTGSYERFLEHNGIVYHHIFDSKTGYPANSGVKSVTILSENSAEADTLATALFVMGVEEGLKFQAENPSFEVLFVTEDNRLIASEGAKEHFTFTGSESGFTYD